MIYLLSAGRVIGIVVLVIVIVAALMLFFPITYRLDADLDNRRVKLRIYWLFRLLRFRFGFEEELEMALAFMLFEIDFLDEERRERRKLRRQGRRNKIEEKKEEEEEEEKSIVQRVTQFVRALPRFFSLMRDYEIFSEAWPVLSLFMFRAIPRDFSGHVEFGLQDPARTGEIIGAISAMPVIYRTELEVTPDFETEKSYASGEIHAKGNVMMIHALILTIRVLRNVKIRGFIGELRHRR